MKDTGLAVVDFRRAARRSAICSTTARSTWSSAPLTALPVLLRNVNPDHHHWVEIEAGRAGPRARAMLSAPRSFSKPTGCACARMCSAPAATSPPTTSARTSALAMRPIAGPPRFTGPRARRKQSSLPAADRIYTITEGKGITGALCARAIPAPWRVPAARSRFEARTQMRAKRSVQLRDSTTYRLLPCHVAPSGSTLLSCVDVANTAWCELRCPACALIRARCFPA